MKFHWLRKTFIGGVLASLTAVLLGSCGGGGATSDPAVGGQLIVLPGGAGAPATFYAGIPQTITITGGRGPYFVTSSEPGILAVPGNTNGSFTVVPNNPGVIDAGLAAGDLPIRTVTIVARDNLGLVSNGVIRVAQNFLTGYGVSYLSNCPAGTGAPPSFCAGGETAVTLNATFNGSLAGNRQFRLEILRGPASFVLPGTNNTGNTVTTVSDHTGRVTAIIRVPVTAGGQLGAIRVIDVATGVYADFVFPIAPATPNEIVAVPNTFSFTAATDRECGTGVGEFLVFGGTTPYNAVSSTADVVVRRIGGSGDQPGRFEIRAINPSTCLTNATVVITDATNARATVTVTTARGDAVAVPDIIVAPTTITLGCGQSGSVTVIGGTGGYSASSSSGAVSAIVGANTVTITRVTGDGATAFPTTATIAITDGGRVGTVGVTIPANCP